VHGGVTKHVTPLIAYQHWLRISEIRQYNLSVLNQGRIYSST